LWQKAYALLKTAYDKKQRTPSVVDQLKNLEEKLNIPMMQRIPDTRPTLERHQGISGPNP
jgi:hypothetical protein